MGSPLAPEFASGWVALKTADAFTTEEFTAAFLMAQGKLGAPGHCAVEVFTKITGGGNDDTVLKVFSVPDATIADRSTNPALSRIIPSSGGDPVRDTFVIDWQQVGSGACISITRDGTTDTLLATIKIRPYRWGLPADH